MRSLFLFSALCGLSAAHFELKYPDSIGFSDDNEDKAPCGGFTPDFSGDLVDFHVGGEALAMRLTHQQSNWLFRITTDEKAESGWEQIFPIVQQSGLGDFCEPSVTVPEKYIGKKGVVSIVSSAVDGLLYQVGLFRYHRRGESANISLLVCRRQFCQWICRCPFRVQEHLICQDLVHGRLQTHRSGRRFRQQFHVYDHRVRLVQCVRDKRSSFVIRDVSGDVSSNTLNHWNQQSSDVHINGRDRRSLDGLRRKDCLGYLANGSHASFM